VTRDRRRKGGMSKTFREWNPEQAMLLPASVLDFVPEDHLAHFVRKMTLEQLDLRAIIDSYDEERGYPPYHPVMMTALVLYAYSQGIYASRRIAKACQQRVDFMAVTGMQQPDFRTVSLFRKRHLKVLKDLFGQVLKLCQKAGMVKLGHVALDGTKMRANASKHKAMSYSHMKKTEAELAAEVERWFDQAEAIDAQEDAEYGADKRGDELPDWVADKQKRLEKIRQAKAELEAEARAAAENHPSSAALEWKAKEDRKRKTPAGVPDDKAQKNFTDPESRIMKTGDGFIQGYNAQAAVDADSQIIVAQTLNNEANDKKQLVPMLDQIRKNTGHQAKEISADAGYCSEDNLKALSRRRIRGYVAIGRQKHGQLAAAYKGSKSPWIQRMKARLKQGGYRSRYRFRKQVVEPVFGLIKQARGFRQFLLRGHENVAAEWSLLCTAHNILKLAAL
jgi:transposase